MTLHFSWWIPHASLVIRQARWSMYVHMYVSNIQYTITKKRNCTIMDQDYHEHSNKTVEVILFWLVAFRNQLLYINCREAHRSIQQRWAFIHYLFLDGGRRFWIVLCLDCTCCFQCYFQQIVHFVIRWLILTAPRTTPIYYIF